MSGLAQLRPAAPGDPHAVGVAGALSGRLVAAPTAAAVTPGLRVFRWAALALYVAVVLIVTLHHEPWRDEADTWLYARDADLATMLGRMPYIGTPALWYLLLFPLAKAGLPYLAQSLLNVAIITLAVVLILWRSPFPPLTRGLLAFSYHFGFEWSVVARTYGLSALFLLAAATLYAGRHARPLRYAAAVALLANTNAHSFFVGGVIGAAYVYECLRYRHRSPRCIAAAALMAAGGLAALVQLWPPADGNIAGHFRFFLPETFLVALATGFIPVDAEWWMWALPLPAVVVALSALALSRLNPVAFSILYGSYALLTYIFVFKYEGAVRHYGFYFLVLVFCLWIAGVERSPDAAGSRSYSHTRLGPAVRRLRYAIVGLNLCLLASVVITADAWKRDIHYAFSGSKEMAEYLKAQRLTGHVIAAYPLYTGESLLPYLDGTRFWYPGLDDFGTYMLWNAAYARAGELNAVEAVDRVQAHFPGRADVLLLTSEPLPASLQSEYRLVYRTQRTVAFYRDEIFYLYAPRS